MDITFTKMLILNCLVFGFVSFLAEPGFSLHWQPEEA
jgi:hypothetical protein